MAEQMAATIEGDERNRLRRAPRGGSERFHAIDERGYFACGYDLPPGNPMPAKGVPEGLRCRRAACLRRFTAADGVTLPVAGWIKMTERRPQRGALIVKRWLPSGAVWAGVYAATDKDSSFDEWVELPTAGVAPTEQPTKGAPQP